MEKEIKVYFRDIDEAVYYLWAARARGEHVYCDFNGYILHSDTVTLDGAYREITGYSRLEYKTRTRKSIEEIEPIRETRLMAYYRDIDEAVNLLLAARARGEHVYCDFNGHILHSDTVTLDGAYLEITGQTKAEKEESMRRDIEEIRREHAEMKERDQRNLERIAASRKGEIKITEDLVVDGLKYIAEHRNLSQEELIDGLLDLGCNFSMEDVKKQFPEEEETLDGLLRGSLKTGACIIVNARDAKLGRAAMEERFFDNDDDISIYHFIRTVTHDDTYTKEKVDKMNNGRSI